MANILITGCAGFIGNHLTEYFLNRGDDLTGIDNLSRKGADLNLKYFSEHSNFKFQKADVRESDKIVDIFKEYGPFDLIIHQAAQVAVTTSVIDPREDLEINIMGTFNLLEATRKLSPDAFFEFASTNKVYGKLADIEVAEKDNRYEFADNKYGISEENSLDFYSPYGCSKGAADQYVRDYSRIYGLNTVVLRKSCIYGTRQYGVEDQGWVAWFVIAAVLNLPMSIYGDGKQIRDILWIDDLVGLYAGLFENSEKTKGEVFNVGGGPENTLSVNELVKILKEEGLLKEDPVRKDWRPGDQKVYVSDINKTYDAIGWKPEVNRSDGIRKLIEWVRENKETIEDLLAGK